MPLLRRLLAALRPLDDERPFEPLIRRRRIRSGEQCVMTMDSTSRHPVQLVSLLRWNDCGQMIDHLRSDGITVFRIGFLPQDLSLRMLDFLCGAALIHQAGLYRIASQTYLLTPRSVTVGDALLQHLEEEGFYTRDSQHQHQRLA